MPKHHVAPPTDEAASEPSIVGSNRLPDLAASIRQEHTATSEALNASIGHAMKAGDLLIEAKRLVPHGQWLPWIDEHCGMSERTAQLYMRVARNRAAIEERISNPQSVADLTLNEAAALLFLTSDLAKLTKFMREIEHLSDEELVQRCLDDEVGIIVDDGYDPFFGRDEEEKREWLLFVLYLVLEEPGWSPESAWMHIEYMLQRIHSVSDLLGEEGERWRRRSHYPERMIKMPDAVLKAWGAFAASRAEMTFADINAELSRIQEERERRPPPQPSPRRLPDEPGRSGAPIKTTPRRPRRRAARS